MSAPDVVDTQCGHVAETGERCKEPGNPCWLQSAYEEVDEYLCSKHQFEQGYCPGCGLFWGGIESFEFSDLHLCDNCEDEVKSELGEYDEDEDDGYCFGEDLP